VADARSRTGRDPGTVLNEIAALLDMDPRKASARAREAVRDYPDLMVARRLLAAALRLIGNATEAEKVELQAIEIGLRQPPVQAAEKALAEDRLEDAEKAIRPYLRENPEDAAGSLILGTIAERCNAPREAENLYRRALLLSPAYQEARIALAKLFSATGRYEDALIVLDEALAREPNHLAALTQRTGLLVQYRRLDEAETGYKRLLRAHPADWAGWMNYAYLLKTKGNIAESITAYRTAIDTRPQNGNAWWGLANLKTVRFDGEDIARMRSILAEDGLSDDDRIHLHFALSKALDDHGDFAGTIAELDRASEMRKAKAPHDPAWVHANVVRSEQIFTPELLAARAGTGFPARDPIFVVSMPRSGSTLVEQILGSHPMIEGTEELYDIERIALELAPGAPSGGYLEKIAGLTPAQLHERGRHYIEATRRHRHTDRPFFTDKMPSNWAFLGLIHLILPNAKIIDVRRHPLGCGFANYSQHYNWGINYSYDLNHIGQFYSDYVRQMAHFDKVAPGLVHRVFYEDLVEDLETEVRRMLDYLGLPFDPACLDFHRSKRAVHTPSAEQVRRPINRDGMDRWRNYEPWLGPLKEALGPVLTLYPQVPSSWPDSGDEPASRQA
jgi:tetratricopeptide (TPR) repeat protein